jgi:serine/threonine protein kinase
MSSIQHIGAYDVLEVIGRGGSSTVFRAKHRVMGRLVALKVLDQPNASDVHWIKRFRLEMQVAGMLSHPNILRAYDAGCDGDAHYLAMELIEGEQLATFIDSKGPLPVETAIDCVCQTALGLAHAHERGIVHRDVKPGNIFRGSNGVCLVFDWGLARLHDARPNDIGGAARVAPIPDPPGNPNAQTKVFAVTRDDAGERRHDPMHTMIASERAGRVEASEAAAIRGDEPSLQQSDSLSWKGHIVGTPAFMSPEQVLGRPIDQRSDIYNLGATLFYLLNGCPMFETGGQLDQLLRAIVEVEPGLLSFHRKDIPPALDSVFQRMVAKDPQSRYQSMPDVINALAYDYKPPRVFISYRREDSLDATDRMFEQLVKRFGSESVFMDVDTIPPGSDFRQRLDNAVAECAVVLAVIGDHWLKVRNTGLLRRRPRIYEANDFVRIEIEVALKRQIPLIPVLVGQARMPAASELPTSIRELAFRQATELRSGRNYHHHLSELITTLDDYMRPNTEKGPPTEP